MLKENILFTLETVANEGASSRQEDNEGIHIWMTNKQLERTETDGAKEKEIEHARQEPSRGKVGEPETSQRGEF